MSIPLCIKKNMIANAEASLANRPYDAAKKPCASYLPIWDQMFDGKFVLAYSGNTQRIQTLKQEFDRVGLDRNEVEIFWNTDDIFVKRLMDAVYDETKYTGRPYQYQFFNNALGHYRIIKGAYKRGLGRILVMEDDVRFLRDLVLLEKVLKAIPKDYEVAMLDSHPTDEGERRGKGLTGHQINEYWWTVDWRTSAGCYSLSRRGMEKMIALYESVPLKNSDDNFRKEIFGSNIYYCNPCIARQVLGESEGTSSVYLDWCWIYDGVGCQRQNYGR